MNRLHYFIALTALLLFTGCNPIQKRIDELQSRMPMQAAPGITANSISFNEKTITIEVSTESFVTLEKQTQKTRMIAAIKRDPLRRKLILKHGFTFTYNFSQKAGKSFSISITPEDLGKAGSGGISPATVAYAMVLIFFFLGLVAICIPRPRGRSYRADLAEKKKKNLSRR